MAGGTPNKTLKTLIFTGKGFNKIFLTSRKTKKPTVAYYKWPWHFWLFGWVLPDLLRCKDPIYKSEKLTGRVLCADSLTLPVVCCEQRSVVCPKEVHILVHLRPTRLWQKDRESKEEGDRASPPTGFRNGSNGVMLTWVWAAGFERKARGHTQKWSLNIGLSRGSGLEVAVEVPTGRGRFCFTYLRENK